MPIIIFQIVPPRHGLSREELQLIVAQAEAAKGEQASERLRGQVIQGVMAKTKPLDVVQALEEEADYRGILLPYIMSNCGAGMQYVYAEAFVSVSVFVMIEKSITTSLSTWKAMLGM